MPVSAVYALYPGAPLALVNEPEIFKTKLPDGCCVKLDASNTGFDAPTVSIGADGCNTWVTICVLADVAITANNPLS